jgi:hypothetical protein
MRCWGQQDEQNIGSPNRKLVPGGQLRNAQIQCSVRRMHVGKEPWEIRGQVLWGHPCKGRSR